MLGICYGLQELVYKFGGAVEKTVKREYGKAVVQFSEKSSDTYSQLFEGISSPFEVWMSHGDKLKSIPDSFVDIASTASAEHCCISNLSKNM